MTFSIEFLYFLFLLFFHKNKNVRILNKNVPLSNPCSPTHKRTHTHTKIKFRFFSRLLAWLESTCSDGCTHKEIAAALMMPQQQCCKLVLRAHTYAYAGARKKKIQSIIPFNHAYLLYYSAQKWTAFRCAAASEQQKTKMLPALRRQQRQQGSTPTSTALPMRALMHRHTHPYSSSCIRLHKQASSAIGWKLMLLRVCQCASVCACRQDGKAILRLWRVCVRVCVGGCCWRTLRMLHKNMRLKVKWGWFHQYNDTRPQSHICMYIHTHTNPTDSYFCALSLCNWLSGAV